MAARLSVAHARRSLSVYYSLTKPGIIYGNGLTTAAGFLFALSVVLPASGLTAIDWWRFTMTLIGSSLVIACGCVLNNIMDREIDRHMARTRGRALVTGDVGQTQALWFAVILGVVGTLLLARYTNQLTVYIGLAGLYLYVSAYGAGKRRGPIGTIIGSFAGATPVLAGYTAASGRIDLTAGLIFLCMVLWQMPHFYAIALYRLKDYQAAGVPVLPAVRGIAYTKRSILVYICLYILAIEACSLAGYTGIVFVVVMSLLGLVWLWRGYTGLHTTDTDTWARRMFGYSLIVMMAFSLLLSGNAILP